MKKITVKEITYYAMLIALNVILTRIGSIRIGGGGTEITRIGFGGYPIIFAGLVLGPIAGGIVGAIGDLVGMLMFPMGPFMPQFTIIAALTGIIPGLIMMMFKDEDSQTSTWKLFLAIGLGQIITSILLTPYFMQKLFDIPMILKVPERIITQAIQVPLYVYITKVLLNRLPMKLKTNE